MDSIYYIKYIKGVGMFKCVHCSKENKNKNSQRQHEVRCRSNTNRVSLDYLKGNLSVNGRMGIEPTPCKFCNKIYDNKIALSNHSTRCAENPNRQTQTLTDVGREKHRLSNQSRIWTDEMRKNHAISMKKAVAENPTAYSSSNRGRTKQIIVDGIKLQGQWEVDFYKWAKEKGLNPVRPSKGFKYVWNGERTYFPDFYIEKLQLYVEVKGYETDRDKAKWQSFPTPLSIIKAKEIDQIRSNTFNVDMLLSVLYKIGLVA